MMTQTFLFGCPQINCAKCSLLTISFSLQWKDSSQSQSVADETMLQTSAKTTQYHVTCFAPFPLIHISELFTTGSSGRPIWFFRIVASPTVGKQPMCWFCQVTRMFSRDPSPVYGTTTQWAIIWTLQNSKIVRISCVRQWCMLHGYDLSRGRF